MKSVKFGMITDYSRVRLVGWGLLAFSAQTGYIILCIRRVKFSETHRYPNPGPRSQRGGGEILPVPYAWAVQHRVAKFCTKSCLREWIIFIRWPPPATWPGLNRVTCLLSPSVGLPGAYIMGLGGPNPLKICRRSQSMFWLPLPPP